MTRQQPPEGPPPGVDAGNDGVKEIPLPSLSIWWARNMTDIPSREWDALAGPLKVPFFEWEWLYRLESSGSIVPENGWQPLHLTVWAGPRLVAAAPLYAKSHSAGEFVFDHIWVDLADRLGIGYYPKLIGMSPVTPAAGYRFLIDPRHDESLMTRLMLNAIERLCQENNLSGVSFLHTDRQWQERITPHGFQAWKHQSFIWENKGYRSFDDFLARFNTNQRKNIRKEMRSLARAGIRLKAFSGDEIPGHFFSLMYRFYEGTNDKFGPWSCKYLTPDFFRSLGRRYRHRLVLMAALKEGREDDPLGMALLLTKGDRLYGRYWGGREHVNYLHFNVCYYGPIQWAIDHGIRWFDPGMGGHHKVRRGFESVPGFSLHRFFDARLQKIMEDNMPIINRMETDQIEEMNRAIPFASDT